jgi:cadmium resistance protein CadD (predicted permease)
MAAHLLLTLMVSVQQVVCQLCSISENLSKCSVFLLLAVLMSLGVLVLWRQKI